MTHPALTLALSAMLAMGGAPALQTKPKPAPLPYLSEPYEARMPDYAPAPRATPVHNDVRDSANGS